MIEVFNSVISACSQGIEPVSQNLQVLSTSNDLVKLRHSLKNLCFYPPSSQGMNPLIEVMKKCLSKSIKGDKIHKLLCYHLINHASYAPGSPSSIELINQIREMLTLPAEKLHPDSGQLFRIFFTMSLFIPSTHSALIQTYIELLKMDVTTPEKKKGGWGKKDKVTLPPKSVLDLCHEVINLLLDLPRFSEARGAIIADQAVVDNIVKIYAISSVEDKRVLIQFFGAEPGAPNAFTDIACDKTILDDPRCATFLVNYRDKYRDLINEIIARPKDGMSSLLRLRLTEVEQTPEMLQAITSDVATTSTSLYSLLRFLELSPEKPQLSDAVMHALYSYAHIPNPTAFCCLCFCSNEPEWLCGFWEDMLRNMNEENRKSTLRKTMDAWIYALDHGKEYIAVVRALFKTMMLNWGSCVDPWYYQRLVEKVGQSGLKEDFFACTKEILEVLPETEAMILALHGNGILNSPDYQFSISDIFSHYE